MRCTSVGTRLLLFEQTVDLHYLYRDGDFSLVGFHEELYLIWQIHGMLSKKRDAMDNKIGSYDFHSCLPRLIEINTIKVGIDGRQSKDTERPRSVR